MPIPIVPGLFVAVVTARREDSSPSKHCPAMRSLGKRMSSVQFRVRASQSSQRSGRFHTLAVPRAALGTATISPPCSSLRISFVKQSRRINTGWRTHFVRSR